MINHETSDDDLLQLAKLGVTVDQTDVQLVGLADNSLAGLGTNSVGNNASVLTVLHHQHVEVLHVVDREVLEARGSDVLGLAVASITLVGHGLLSLVTAADGGVLTAGLTPAGAQLGEELITMTSELLRALLQDSLRDDSLHHG